MNDNTAGRLQEQPQLENVQVGRGFITLHFQDTLIKRPFGSTLVVSKEIANFTVYM